MPRAAASHGLRPEPRTYARHSALARPAGRRHAGGKRMKPVPYRRMPSDHNRSVRPSLRTINLAVIQGNQSPTSSKFAIDAGLPPALVHIRARRPDGHSTPCRKSAFGSAERRLRYFRARGRQLRAVDRRWHWLRTCDHHLATQNDRHEDHVNHHVGGCRGFAPHAGFGAPVGR